MPSWYTINWNPSGDTARVDLLDDIGLDERFPVSGFVQLLNAITAKNIDLHINSNGGEILAGMEIYNALKNHPAEITGYVDSIAASIGSTIAMGCDLLVMERNAYLMIHNGHGAAKGDPEAMRKQADLLDKLCGTIAQIYADKCGKPVDQIRALMAAETWFEATEAKAIGLCDEICSDSDETQEQAMAASAVRAMLKFQSAPPKLRRFAARLVGQPTRKETPMPLAIYARDGKHFVKIGETEHEVAVPAQPEAGEQMKAQLDKARTEGRDSERAYRGMFNTILASASLTGAAAEQFEKEFYGRAEADLKFLASHAIGTRAKPLGEAAPGNGEGEAQTDAQKAEAKLTDDETARFAADANLRRMYGCQTGNAAAPEYKAALEKHLAGERRWAADLAKSKKPAAE